MALPRFIAAYALEIYSSKLSLVFSNVPGPRKNYVVGGKRMRTMQFFVP